MAISKWKYQTKRKPHLGYKPSEVFGKKTSWFELDKGVTYGDIDWDEGQAAFHPHKERNLTSFPNTTIGSARRGYNLGKESIKDSCVFVAQAGCYCARIKGLTADKLSNSLKGKEGPKVEIIATYTEDTQKHASAMRNLMFVYLGLIVVFQLLSTTTGVRLDGHKYHIDTRCLSVC